MFEDYIEDACHFASEAGKAPDDRQACRDYRAAVFYALGAVEAFINFIADTFAQDDGWPAFEVAFLSDKRFGTDKGSFKVLDQIEYHRLEEKLRYLIWKFDPSFDFNLNAAWCQLLEFKEMRDTITHPRQDKEELRPEDYQKQVKTGISAVFTIVDHLCVGIFKRHLRKQLTDLRPSL